MKISLFWKPLLWLALIAYGLFLPANELPVKPFLKIPHFDKFVHFCLFFGLSLLLFRPFKKLKMNYMLLAPAIALFFGAVLELIQNMLSPTRSSDYYDFIANAAGIIASIFFYRFLVAGKKWEKWF